MNSRSILMPSIAAPAAYGVPILFPIARRNPVTLVVPFSKAFSNGALGGASIQFAVVILLDLQLNEYHAQGPHPRKGCGKGARAVPGTGACRFPQHRAGPTRCRSGVRAGPRTRRPRPQEHRRRRGGTERDPSPIPLFAPLQCQRTRKKGRNRHRLLPSYGRQYSSSIAPWTVCTTRLARCAGSAL